MVLIYSNVIGNVDNLIIAAADNTVFTILFSIIITKSPHAILSCIDGISVIFKMQKSGKWNKNSFRYLSLY